MIAELAATSTWGSTVTTLAEGDRPVRRLASGAVGGEGRVTLIGDGDAKPAEGKLLICFE